MNKKLVFLCWTSLFAFMDFKSQEMVHQSNSIISAIVMALVKHGRGFMIH